MSCRIDNHSPPFPSLPQLVVSPHGEQSPLEGRSELMSASNWSRAQTPPSHEEKRSGEPSQISCTSTWFSNNVTKYFVPNLLKKGADTQVEIRNLTFVREVQHNNL